MSDLNVAHVDYGNEDTNVESIDLGTSDLSCAEHSLESDFQEVSSVTELDTADISSDGLNIEGGSLDIDSVSLSGNVEVICGSVGGKGDGIQSISYERSTEDDGDNIMTITLSSGEETIVRIKNGSRGSDGADGRDGVDGQDGYTPIKGIDYGDGYTPVKGVDYSDGVGIADISVAESDEPEGENNVEITLTNGVTSSFSVKNGKEGPQGIPGTGAITSLNEYTLAEYMDMKNRGLLNNSFYTVYKNGELYRMYLGETLVAKKAESGEQVTLGMAYPLVFPIIFA